MIEFKPGTYFSAMWFVDQPPKSMWHILPNMNLMIALYRIGETWSLKYRFRYYTLENENEKSSWHELRMAEAGLPEATEAAGLKAGHLLAELTLERNQSRMDFVPLNCDGMDAFPKVQDRPWMQLKREATPEEAAEILKDESWFPKT